jgi:CheY-like chemotaxis protein
MVGILVVDDSAMMRKILRAVLEPLLHVVGEAADGMAAVQLVQQLRPEVVLIDVYMPRLNGIESTRLIRALSLGTIVVGMSSDISSVVEEELLSAGACAFLPKEDLSTTLLAVIARELSR